MNRSAPSRNGRCGTGITRECRRSRSCRRVRGVAAAWRDEGVDGDEEAGAGHRTGRRSRGAGPNRRGSNTPAATGGRWRCSRWPSRGSGASCAACRADRERDGDVEGVAAHEDDVGGLDGYVGAGADGDADVGLGQGGGVVDAVADHGDLLATLLELGDLGALSPGRTSAKTLSMPSSSAMRRAVASLSPVSITTRRRASCSAATAAAEVAGGVRHGDHPGRDAVDGDEDGGAPRAPFVPASPSSPRSTSSRSISRRLPTATAAGDLGVGAVAGVLEAGRGDSGARRGGAADDGVGQGVLGVALDGGGQGSSWSSVAPSAMTSVTSGGPWSGCRSCR